ncbi:unnamed protein product [Rotaria sp. Silwood2]|nr:unnamed protein product [Rotaria sp. Silwood2]CAF4502349.1 unnamed protein product [Rotaria sp. Silwood2]
MSLLHYNRCKYFKRLLTFYTNKIRFLYNRSTPIVLVTFSIYIAFATVAYYLLLKPFINTLLIPGKRPHDRNFVSKLNNRLPIFSNATNRRDFILVTASSAEFVDRLENLIGSIHFHEPHTTILVFDLGMTDSQLSRLSCMINIKIELFPFEIHPSHVANLESFAYKALLLKELFEKYRFTTKVIVYLDAGTELRSSLDPIIELIQTHGYFFTRQKTLIIDHTDEQTFSALNTSKNDFSYSHYQTAGGILGFATNHSGFYKDILRPFVACSLNVDCIAPITSRSSMKHRFDQSVLSILVHKAGYKVESEERFHGDFGSEPELDASMVIFSRRWHCPKIYASEVVFRRACTYSPVFRSRHRLRNIHEHASVYGCGTLTVVQLRSFQIELPFYQVYMIIYIIYIFIMSFFYCWALHVLRLLLSIIRIKQRRA